MLVFGGNSGRMVIYLIFLLVAERFINDQTRSDIEEGLQVPARALEHFSFVKEQNCVEFRCYERQVGYRESYLSQTLRHDFVKIKYLTVVDHETIIFRELENATAGLHDRIGVKRTVLNIKSFGTNSKGRIDVEKLPLKIAFLFCQETFSEVLLSCVKRIFQVLASRYL